MMNDFGSTDWIQAWLQMAAPHEPQKFKRRLNWDSYSAESFQKWLSSDPGDLGSAPLGWAEALDSAQALLRTEWDMPLLPYGKDPSLPFVDLWWPIRGGMAKWLRDQPFFDESSVSSVVTDQLASALLKRLCSITDQVLWELFSTDRTPGVMLLSHLGASGDGSGPPLREHYESFIRQHRRDGLKTLLSKFPVLKRLIGTVLVLWCDSCREMLQRINADRPALEAHFGIPSSHCLVALQQDLSDPHRGGRSVAVLEFSSPVSDDTEVLRVVYKPKDMGVDAAYQALLADLNANSDLPPLRCLTVHLADGYGYMEYVSHQLCADAKELERFYINAGRLTAVLHLLGCTDCHYENLIACADQLLLIDTETLLEADVADHVDSTKSRATPPLSQLHERCQRSVLRSGLLPSWMFIGAAKRPVDISALGVAPPATAKTQTPGWLGLNSDGMMPGRETHPVSIPTSLPVGIGSPNPLNQHLEWFCSGFGQQMHELERLKSRWLAAGSVLDAFAKLPRRIVLRATRVYFAIQRQQLQPAALRSPFAQAIKLEQLARSFLLAESRPLHWPVLEAEQQQMQRLDIPFFTHAIDGDSLQLDAEGGLLPGFIETSGLKAARQRLEQLNDDECAFQLQLIRGACMAKQQRAETIEAVTAINPSEPEREFVNTCGSHEAATAVAQQLLDLAIRDPNGQVEWLGMDLGRDGERFGFGAVGLSLYGGSIGTACLLNELRRVGVDLPDGETVMNSILAPLEDLIADADKEAGYRWWRDQSLGISGSGGILLSLLALGRNKMFDDLLALLPPRVLEADQQLDLIGGCCGLIGPLLQRGSDPGLEMAIRAGDHLLGQQQEQGGWPRQSSGHPLLGLSHGTAGMAAALARLHAACGETRFRDGAAAALSYERGHFKQEQGNWPDFREGVDSESFMVSWCHGAPGVALGRACLWETDLWDEDCDKEIAIALSTTAGTGNVMTDHLCCGSLGLMMILEQLTLGPWALTTKQREDAVSKATWFRRDAVHRCNEGEMKLRCYGTQDGGLVLPGFFTGLSGMGLALLQTPASDAMVMKLLSGGLLMSRN